MLFDVAVSTISANMTVVPLLSVIACLCPSGLEGIVFSFFSSIYNFSNDVLQAQTSSIAMSHFGITAHRFDGIVQFKLLCMALQTITPWMLVWMLPSEQVGMLTRARVTVSE